MGRSVAQQVARARGYEMASFPMFHSYALASQRGAVSRNHVDPNGVATLIKNHFGQKYWFVMVDPKENSLQKRTESFRNAYVRWFEQEWDMLVLNPADTL